MANYPIPPWLSPQAAQGYGELAGQASRAALSAQLEREQMSQRATQFAIEAQQRSQQTAAEMQARQEQLERDHQIEQQKIAIENAYRQQQLSLQAQDNDLAERKFSASTDQAAKQFTANQAFQKAIMPKEEGGEGLSATQAALKYMAPYMTGTEVGRLASLPNDFKPGNTFKIPDASGESLVQVSPDHWVKYATVPPTITNAPPAIPVTGEDGEPIGHWVQVPGGQPRWQPVTKGAGDDIATILKKRQQGQTPPTTKTSTAVDSKPLPLPSKKDDLVKGTLYMTGRGPAIWDGEKFVKQ